MSLNEIFFQFDNEKATMSFPSEKVEAKIIDKKINDHIYFTKANLSFKEDVKVYSQSKADGIILDFNLLGEVDYKSTFTDHSFKTSNNRTDIELISEESTESIVKKGDINKFTIIIKKEFLSQILPSNQGVLEALDSLENKYCHKLLSSKSTSSKTNSILNQLANSNIYNEGLGEVFIQSKVYELIYHELETLFSKNEKKDYSVKFNEQDIFALNKAKEIILSLDEDCSISTLSRKVALNEFKLKHGFKKYFNTSPGNMLLQQKMLKAKELLETSEYNINEVSKIVGYKYQQSFTSAFTKYFGITPRELIKSRNYYY